MNRQEQQRHQSKQELINQSAFQQELLELHNHCIVSINSMQLSAANKYKLKDLSSTLLTCKNQEQANRVVQRLTIKMEKFSSTSSPLTSIRESVGNVVNTIKMPELSRRQKSWLLGSAATVLMMLPMGKAMAQTAPVGDLNPDAPVAENVVSAEQAAPTLESLQAGIDPGANLDATALNPVTEQAPVETEVVVNEPVVSEQDLGLGNVEENPIMAEASSTPERYVDSETPLNIAPEATTDQVKETVNNSVDPTQNTPTETIQTQANVVTAQQNTMGASFEPAQQSADVATSNTSAPIPFGERLPEQSPFQINATSQVASIGSMAGATENATTTQTNVVATAEPTNGPEFRSTYNGQKVYVGQDEQGNVYTSTAPFVDNGLGIVPLNTKEGEAALARRDQLASIAANTDHQAMMNSSSSFTQESSATKASSENVTNISSAGLSSRVLSGEFTSNMTGSEAANAVDHLTQDLQKIEGASYSSYVQIAQAFVNGNSLPEQYRGQQLTGGVSADNLFEAFKTNPDLAGKIAQGTVTLNVTEAYAGVEASSSAIVIPPFIFGRTAGVSYQEENTAEGFVAADTVLVIGDEQFTTIAASQPTNTENSTTQTANSFSIENGVVSSRFQVAGVTVERNASGQDYLVTEETQVPITAFIRNSIENGQLSTNQVLNIIANHNPNDSAVQGGIDLGAGNVINPINIEHNGSTYDIWDLLVASNGFDVSLQDSSGQNVDSNNSVLNYSNVVNAVNFLKHASPQQAADFYATLKVAHNTASNGQNLADETFQVQKAMAMQLTKVDPYFFNNSDQVLRPNSLDGLLQGYTLNTVDPVIQAAHNRALNIYNAVSSRTNRYENIDPSKASYAELMEAISDLRDQVEHDKDLNLTDQQINEMFNFQSPEYQAQIEKLEALDQAMGRSSSFVNESDQHLTIGLGGIGSKRTVESHYSTNGSSIDQVQTLTNEVLSGSNAQAVEQNLTVLGIVPINGYVNPLLTKVATIAANLAGLPAFGVYSERTTETINSRVTLYSPEEMEEISTNVEHITGALTDEGIQLRTQAMIRGERNNTGMTPEQALFDAINKGETTTGTYFYEYEANGVLKRIEFSNATDRDAAVRAIVQFKGEILTSANQLGSDGRTSSGLTLLENPNVTFETGGTVSTFDGVEGVRQEFERRGAILSDNFASRLVSAKASYDVNNRPEIQGETITVSVRKLAQITGQPVQGIGTFGGGPGSNILSPEYFIGNGNDNVIMSKTDYDKLVKGEMSLKDIVAMLEACENDILWLLAQIGDMSIKTGETHEFESQPTMVGATLEQAYRTVQEMNASGSVTFPENITPPPEQPPVQQEEVTESGIDQPAPPSAQAPEVSGQPTTGVETPVNPNTPPSVQAPEVGGVAPTPPAVEMPTSPNPIPAPTTPDIHAPVTSTPEIIPPTTPVPAPTTPPVYHPTGETGANVYVNQTPSVTSPEAGGLAQPINNAGNVDITSPTPANIAPSNVAPANTVTVPIAPPSTPAVQTGNIGAPNVVNPNTPTQLPINPRIDSGMSESGLGGVSGPSRPDLVSLRQGRTVDGVLRAPDIGGTARNVGVV
jgi:hypothetical protein